MGHSATWFQQLRKLSYANISGGLIEKGQSRVIDASLTLIRERAKLKGELVRSLGGVKASATLLGIPLGHNSSFLQGPAFAPPRIREAIWCGSTNSSTEEGKELNDPRVLTDVGDVPVQEIRDCGINDDKLMNIISESVKIVMEEEPLHPLILGGDHSISYPVVRAISEKLGGPVDILHLDAHPDIYDAFEGNKYSHASPFARIMEGGHARRLLQVGLRSINKEGREQGKRFGVEQYEMRTFSRDRQMLENLEKGTRQIVGNETWHEGMWYLDREGLDAALVSVVEKADVRGQKTSAEDMLILHHRRLVHPSFGIVTRLFPIIFERANKPNWCAVLVI